MKPGNQKIVLLAVIGLFILILTTGVGAQTNPDIINFIYEDGLAKGTPVTVTVDPGGWAWIGNSSIDVEGVGGLSIITRNRKVLTFYKEDGLAANPVNDITIDVKHDCVWIATSNGLSRWDGKTGKWETFNKSNSELKTNDINIVYIDKDNNRWIGTHGGGLYRIIAEDTKIERVKCPMDKVTSVIIDKKGRLWVSAFEGVTYKEDTIWVPYNTENSTLPSNRVYEVAEGSEGHIIAATNRGLSVFDGISWNTIDSKNSKLPVDHTTSLLVDGKGNLWVATLGGGLVKFDPKREKVWIFNRKNSNILDNQVTSMAEDKTGNMWVATTRGVSYMILNPKEIVPEVVQAVNKQAFRWESEGADGKDITTMFALAMNRYGYVTWAYAAYFAGEGFMEMDPKVTIDWNIFDNRWLTITDKSTKREFLQVCSTEGKITRHYAVDRDKLYPFPNKFPREVQVYLMPGKFFPSDNPEIKKMAKAFVKRSSEGDMVKTAEDILFSKFFTTMPFDYSRRENAISNGETSTDPREIIIRTPKQIIDDKMGVCYSKNRVAVTMLRSVGIPARLIFKNGPYIWGEAYINKWGWVPFDVTMPIYTMSDVHSRRIEFPHVVEEKDLGVAWVDGADDDMKTIFWRPPVEVRFSLGPDRVKEMMDLDKLKTAKFLVIRPADVEITPDESKMPVSKTLKLMVKKDGQFFNLRFYNHAGVIVKRIPITGYYKITTAEVEGKVRLKFVPSYMGDYIILRMFEWKVLDEGVKTEAKPATQPETKPTTQPETKKTEEKKPESKENEKTK
ncbi:MAG: hypothetical protein K8T10_16650 [Candidatus Eremiobacteraeota bacterium]|nr:hypothetical protein [Candidatus Eremiobacteraeota bacterium]